MTELRSEIVPRHALGSSDVDRLYELFTAYYHHVERAAFERDLGAKEWVIRLVDDAGGVAGFTTFALYEPEVAGRRVRVAFNGNTVVAPEHWGQQELVRAWTRFMAARKAEEPATPVYWYLIASGYRTYLYLPLFYREFYPCHGRPTPAFEQALLDVLGRRLYPTEYRDGVIRPARPRECLRDDLAVPPPHKLRKPHVRFFVERNPGYRRGDELACVAEFALANIRGFPREIARQRLAAR